MPERGLRLYELMQAPELPGVYAWYYRIELSDKDITDCIASCNCAASDDERCAVVRLFLERRLFSYYREQPYQAVLTGPLKPTYSGLLENEMPISPSLVTRLAAKPDRLWALKDLLQQSIPFFASPIYIGVAKNLRRRLLRHKSLIERYQQSMAAGLMDPVADMDAEDDGERDKDHSFAREVATSRRFATYNLVVHVMELETDEDGLRVDIENLLNRINYPLCGRN